MMGRRQERAASQVRAAISGLLLREVKDPRLAKVLVTRVEMSVDLKHATVFVVASGGEPERERALAGLRRAQGFIRSQLGRYVGLRYTPELKFMLDRAIDDACRVEQLLEEAGLGPSSPGVRSAGSSGERDSEQ